MKKINILIILILLGIIFLLYFILSYDKKMYFKLNGEENIELNIGEDYKEKGYEAKLCSKYVKFLCQDYSDKFYGIRLTFTLGVALLTDA